MKSTRWPITGRKVLPAVQLKATVKLFTPHISFKRGIRGWNFMLYIKPAINGKMSTSNTFQLWRIPMIRDRIRAENVVYLNSFK